MRCLFCKQSSSDTKSVEHIVPESLGNTTFILPLGYVCDKCNNYFAREVEKPFLELLELRLLRFQEAIPNKKNKMPVIDGLLNGNCPIKLKRKLSHDEVVNEGEVSTETMDKILKSSEETTIIVPAFTNEMLPPNNSIISRFLAKMALEALADKLKDIENSLEHLINDSQFDMLRKHARLGNIKNWPCSIRRIYDYNKIWELSDGHHGQMIHESDFLLIPVEENFELAAEYIMTEIYFVIALWGIEFAINMAGPEISGYENWLKAHDDKSPLYCRNNERI